MKLKYSLTFIFSLASMVLANPSFADVKSIDEKVELLLSKMTIEEKIGQTVLLAYSRQEKSLPGKASDRDIQNGICGNFTGIRGAETTKRLQRIAVEKSRLGIPLLFALDVVHGHHTIFPIGLGQASSWNMKLIEEADRIAAIEASADGVHLSYSPMLDISRDPRWGRVAEGVGEDVFLGSAIAGARVRGFQGDDLSARDTIIACVKHYAGYGASQAGRDYHTVDMSERRLREVHLPTFKAAIEEGAESVMSAFNELNGTPITADAFMLKTILRDEMGFKGFVVTDYTAINEMVAHGTAKDLPEAGKQALMAGIDMDLAGAVFQNHLQDLLDNQMIGIEDLNRAARNVLRAKFKLGLFENPYRYCDLNLEQVISETERHRDVAYKAACESLVLLKNNDGLLPLKPNTKIALIGPLADSSRNLIGWGTPALYEQKALSIKQALMDSHPGEINYVKGCPIVTDDTGGFTEALQAAENSDVVVMVLGEKWDMSGEASSRANIDLPGQQSKLLAHVKQSGKPIVLLTIQGRPLILSRESEQVDSLMVCWFPGIEGGTAIADTLLGKNNPSGKLPVTFPRSIGQIPIHYDMKNTGRPQNPMDLKNKWVSRYLDVANSPLYPFGFGMSYSQFSYSDLLLSCNTLRPGQHMTVSMTVKNESERAGDEIVQLYIRDLVGSVTRPVKSLKGFKKISLAGGESEIVSFKITEKELAFYKRDMSYGVESGEFQVWIASSSQAGVPAIFNYLDDI
jgi:beta-glucosidase